MANAKIEFRLGDITFSSEGEEAWVASQLDKLLQMAPDLVKKVPAHLADFTNANDKVNDEHENGKAVGTLASFLQKHSATSNQIKRFLVTAEWLHKKGNKRPTTNDVTKSLKDNHQSRLSNPADCLNKCVAKGHCEKDGKSFFVTPEGRASLVS